MKSASSAILAITIVVAAMRPVSAQNTAEAESLFREGKKLMKLKRYAEACPKLEASERLDPQYGTEVNLGDCFSKHGQTASAWAMFAKAEATAKHASSAKRASHARKRADELEKQLVYLTISVPADSKIEELVIKRNGAAVDVGVWNEQVPLDPDEYTIEAEAPGHIPWSASIALKSVNKVILVPRLDELPEEAGPPQRETPEKPRTSSRHSSRREPPPPPPPEITPPRKYRTQTIALGIGGAAAIGLGTGFALYASHVEGEADAACPHTKCYDAHAVDLNHVARMDGWIANIGWILGSAALAGAGVAWYLGGQPQARDHGVAIVPIVDRNGGGFALGGQF